MAALERYFLSKGMSVAGYDRTETALTRELEHEGVKISYIDSTDTIPAEFRQPDDDTLVVYTPRRTCRQRHNDTFCLGRFPIL